MFKNPTARLVADNPFYGLRATLQMVQQLPKLADSVTFTSVQQLLDKSWQECKNDKAKRELFYVLLFSIGDIQNREHNIFRKRSMRNIDGGGMGSRKTFAYILQWIAYNDAEQFYSFLPIIGEYYNLDGMMLYELKTDRYKGRIKEVLKLDVDMDRITTYIASILKNGRTTENEKKLWARWLWHVPTSKRITRFVVTPKGLRSVQKKFGPEKKVGDLITTHRLKQLPTVEKDQWTLRNIELLSEKMGWEIRKYKHYKVFAGYKQFKKQYLADSEATLFSSQIIKEMDRTQLLNWFDQLPAGARFRAQTRLLNKDTSGKFTLKEKWFNSQGENIGKIYLDWLTLKDQSQKELRQLSQEDKEKLKNEDSSRLKQMEKAAKVNTGAETLLDIVADFFNNISSPSELDIKAQSILDKISIEVPVMIVTDVSGSMSSSSVEHKGVVFTAQRMAQLITTVFLLKNPKEELRNMFIRFDSTAEIVTEGQKLETSGNNRFMSNAEVTVGSLIDSTLSFSYNFNNIEKYVISRGGTHFSTVSKTLKNWVDEDSSTRSRKIEMINQYPVWLVPSDGDMNNASDATSSMGEFLMNMKQWFGWEGVVVVWDVKREESNSNKFHGLENVIYYSGINPNVLNQIFRNIHDLDVIDVYTPLKSAYLSNRYEPVKELVI